MTRSLFAIAWAVNLVAVIGGSGEFVAPVFADEAATRDRAPRDLATRGRDTGGTFHVVTYDAKPPGEGLVMGVTYTLWVPKTDRPLRGVIVHQHGCGEGACKGGETAAYDWQWQALARKWDCALLGPSYHQKESVACTLWCDPRNGSDATFRNALDALAEQTGRAELASVPWCLWGHSGGGTWASHMLRLHPERVVAAWLRSGASVEHLPAEGTLADASEAIRAIPVMGNPGRGEKSHERFRNAWNATRHWFEQYRALDAPVGFAPDPNTVHECGDSRSLAIVYFDACLALRLPKRPTSSRTDADQTSNRADASAARPVLRTVDLSQGYLADPPWDETVPVVAVPAKDYAGDPRGAVWLPSEAVAAAWVEYVTTGHVPDKTPPAPPTNFVARPTADGRIELTWRVDADLESGIRQFLIERDGETIATVPEKPTNPYGGPLAQGLSYHDTPTTIAVAPRALVAGRTPEGRPARYRVVAVNGAGLRSDPSQEITVEFPANP